MGGANYMGGRRNIAKAKSKDVLGRAQKGHFMHKRHQILANSLKDSGSVEAALPPPGTLARVEDINFAHARRDLGRRVTTDQNVERGPEAPSRALPPSSSCPSSTSMTETKRSRILDKLDVCEPTGLRRTMDRLLRQSDFAGLKGKVRPVKTPPSRSSVSYDASEVNSPVRKRARPEFQATTSVSASGRNMSEETSLDSRRVSSSSRHISSDQYSTLQNGGSDLHSSGSSVVNDDTSIDVSASRIAFSELSQDRYSSFTTSYSPVRSVQQSPTYPQPASGSFLFLPSESRHIVPDSLANSTRGDSSDAPEILAEDGLDESLEDILASERRGVGYNPGTTTNYIPFVPLCVPPHIYSSDDSPEQTELEDQTNVMLDFDTERGTETPEAALNQSPPNFLKRRYSTSPCLGARLSQPFAPPRSPTYSQSLVPSQLSYLSQESEVLKFSPFRDSPVPPRLYSSPISPPSLQLDPPSQPTLIPLRTFVSQADSPLTSSDPPLGPVPSFLQSRSILTAKHPSSQAGIDRTAFFGAESSWSAVGNQEEFAHSPVHTPPPFPAPSKVQGTAQSQEVRIDLVQMLSRSHSPRGQEGVHHLIAGPSLFDDDDDDDDN